MKKRCQDFTSGNEADVNGAVEIVYCTRPEGHGGEHVNADSGSGPYSASVHTLRTMPLVRARW